MLVALVSAKGAPGVTTTALCLVAGAAGRGLVVEVDPAGGDLECWTGPHGEAGLVGLAARPHAFGTSSDLDGYAVDIADGLRAVVAPTTETAMAGLLSRSVDQLGQALAASGELDVFADLGRFSGSSATTPLAAASDLVVVVCRPTLDSIEHTRGLLAPGGVVDAAPTPAAVVVVGGDRPYGPDEIARVRRVCRGGARCGRGRGGRHGVGRRSRLRGRGWCAGGWCGGGWSGPRARRCLRLRSGRTHLAAVGRDTPISAATCA